MELSPQASLQLVDRALPEVSKLLVAIRVEAMSDHGIPIRIFFSHAGSATVTGVPRLTFAGVAFLMRRPAASASESQ